MLDTNARSEAAQVLPLVGRENCPVHCECKVVQFFSPPHGPEWVPPFNYIGVSKLSCGACRVWLEAYNEFHDRPFYTRGSHGAWYWPWGMPNVEASLGGAVVKKIRRAYIEHQDEEPKAQSTVASRTLRAKNRLTRGQRRSIFSSSGKKLQEFTHDHLPTLYNSLTSLGFFE